MSEQQPATPVPPGRFFKLVARALLLRCPLCGKGRLFRRFFRMETECEHCGLKFQREPGFFLGSIYFNYGLTGLIVAIAYPILLFGYRLPERTLLIAGVAFSILFPMIFFRWARSLWLGFDQFVDPRSAKEE